MFPTDIYVEDIYTQLDINTLSITNLNNKIQFLGAFIIFCVVFCFVSLVIIVYEMHIIKYKLKSKINKLKLNV
mgnify:CR=1 FL=1